MAAAWDCHEGARIRFDADEFFLFVSWVGCRSRRANGRLKRFVKTVIVSLMLSASIPNLFVLGQAQTRAATKLLLFNIPAMPLQQALERYGAVTGSAIMYNSHLAEGRRSHPVVGLYAPTVALRMLLDDSDLTVRYTSPTDLMLMSGSDVRAAEGSGATAGTRSSGSLVLDTLYVDVPPGSEKRQDFGAYGQAVRAEIKRALARDRRTASRIYQAQIDVWIAGTGRLRFPRFVKATGQSEADDDIRRVIESTTLKEPPPKGLPQPLRLTIIAL